jgi:hypothetical protein
MQAGGKREETAMAPFSQIFVATFDSAAFLQVRRVVPHVACSQDIASGGTASGVPFRRPREHEMTHGTLTVYAQILPRYQSPYSP